MFCLNYFSGKIFAFLPGLALDFGFPACGFLHSWIPDVHHRAWLID
jgi:hypothetical protein